MCSGPRVRSALRKPGWPARRPPPARTGPSVPAAVSASATRRAPDRTRLLRPSRFPSKLEVETRRWFRSRRMELPSQWTTDKTHWRVGDRLRPCDAQRWSFGEKPAPLMGQAAARLRKAETECPVSIRPFGPCPPNAQSGRTGRSSSCEIRSWAAFFNPAESRAIARSPTRSGCGTRRSSASTSSCRSASICWRSVSDAGGPGGSWTLIGTPCGRGIDTNIRRPIHFRHVDVETSWCRYQRASRFFRPNPAP